MEAELSRWQLAYETISTLMTSVAGSDPTAIWRPLLYYPIDVNEMYWPLLRENRHASDGHQVVTPVHFCTRSVDGRLPVARAQENMSNPTRNRMHDDSQLRTETESTSHRSAPCHSTNEVGAMNHNGNLEEPQNTNWRTFIFDQENSTRNQQYVSTDFPSSHSQHDRSRLIRVANDDHRHRHLPNFSREGARRRIDGDIIYENHSLQRPFHCDMNLPINSPHLSSEDGRASVRNMAESDVNQSMLNRVNACDLFHRLMKNFYTETFLWIYVNTLLHPGSRRILNRIRFLALETGRSLQQATYDMLSGFLNGYQHSRLPLLTEIDRSLREISVESFQMRYPTESNIQSIADVERGAHLRQLSLELGAVLNPRQMLRSFGSVVREVSMQTIASPGHQQRNFLHQFHDWSYPTAGQDPFFFPGHSISQRGFPDNGLPQNFVHPWQTIPPPPPPYPGFLLHFLAMLDQPSVPQEIPDYYHVDDFDTYESLSELADRLGEAKLSGLTDSDIQQLPVYFYEVTDVRRESSSLQDTCVICLGQFEKGHRLRMLPCGHDYHDKCIDRWLKIKDTCPVCRCHLNTSFS